MRNIRSSSTGPEGEFESHETGVGVGLGVTASGGDSSLS